MKSLSNLPWMAILGIAVLACVGVAMLTLAAGSALMPSGSGSGTTQQPTALAQATAFVLPTTTPAPVVEATATTEPTAIVATDTPATDPSATPASQLQLQINVPANIRSGPSQAYQTIGGINPGEPNVLIGRDATAQWFVIQYTAAADGKGWISNLVASYAGNVNDLPVVQPSSPPPAVTNTPKPAATNPPAAATNTSAPAGGYSSRGIVGQAFSVENPNVATNELVWFNFTVKNTSSSDVNYSVLAAHTDTGPNAKSWSDQVLKAGETLTWRDHIEFSSAGTYQLYLAICYGGFNACYTNAVSWDRLSANVTITVR